jgi:hypothetical protein
MGRTKGNGAQDVSLEQPGCVHESVAIHEFLHAVGFAHEQTRPDRDTYVKVYYENIISGRSMDFPGGLNESRSILQAKSITSSVLRPVKSIRLAKHMTMVNDQQSFHLEIIIFRLNYALSK